MNNQRGFYNIDMTVFVVVICLVAALGGIAAWETLEWLWPYVKSAIHRLTA